MSAEAAFQSDEAFPSPDEAHKVGGAVIYHLFGDNTQPSPATKYFLSRDRTTGIPDFGRKMAIATSSYALNNMHIPLQELFRQAGLEPDCLPPEETER